MRVLDAVFVEPFHGGSHAAFAAGYTARSRHRWRIVALPAERWKWRMRLAGLLLGPQLAALDPPPQLVLASGLLDLAHLRQQAGRAARAPFVLYLHENQFAYPRPRGEELDRGFAVAHLASLAAADAVAFNSRAHQAAFVAGLARFLDEAPGPHPAGLRERAARAAVCPPGLDLQGFPEPAERPVRTPPVIAWNHRWEEDKRPSAFARIVLRLAERGRAFDLVLLGTTDQVRPRPLELIRERLGPRILHAGPAPRDAYVAWLGRADIAVSVAAQENFGYAALEAMAAGAVPLLPRRLSYPEIVPPALHADLLYETDRELLARLSALLAEPERLAPLRVPAMRAAHAHEWGERARALDDFLDTVAR